MRDSNWRGQLEHRPRVESCEPRWMMTGQTAIGVILNTSFVTPNDGLVNAADMAAPATSAAPGTSTEAASGIYNLVGLTTEQTVYGLTGVGQTVAVIDSG